jgi:hypothetical protein
LNALTFFLLCPENLFTVFLSLLTPAFSAVLACLLPAKPVFYNLLITMDFLAWRAHAPG